MISIENRQGLRRLLWEADLTYEKFGMFRKYQLPTHLFYKWQRLNHGCWQLYWKIYKVKYRRIGYLTHGK